ncbi:hypothetical protein [Pseudonocardia sp.]|uniref:hypothetical protein n=1 Tax=Pseudonocardia sp. TaxID=60912 RepID=UPI003D114A89
MIPGVQIAGHTGRVVIEPIASTDGKAAVWLRPPDERATCVWLTAAQLRHLGEIATERADYLTANAPYVCQIEALTDPAPEPAPPARTWRSRLRDALGFPTTPEPNA